MRRQPGDTRYCFSDVSLLVNVKPRKIADHLLLVFSLHTVVLVAIIALGSAFITRYQVIHRINTSLKNIVATAALSIDGTRHAHFTGPLAEQDEAWQATRHFLARVRAANGLEPDHLYSFTIPDPDNPAVLKFAVMLHDRPFIGDVYEVTPENIPRLQRLIETQEPETSEIYEDEYGTWISAYAPIIDETGRVNGILEADYRVDDERFAWFRLLTLHYQPVLALFIAVLGPGLFLVLVTARSFARPIEQFVTLTESIQQEQWDHPIPEMRWDEMGRLRVAFEMMRHKIQRQMGELQRFAGDLEVKVRERTHELEEKNLMVLKTQKQMAINEKMASLGTLTAGIAHELKNPLNFVNNISDVTIELIEELLQELENLPKDMAYLREDLEQLIRNTQIIRKHGLRADTIVANMMELANDQGHFQEVELNAVLNEFVRLAWYSQKVEEQSFRLIEDYDPSIGKVFVNPKNLGKAIMSLVNNGVESMMEKEQPSGCKATLTVSSRALEDRIEITVRDNGTGIPEEDLTRIFTHFFTTRPTGSGHVGLGLPIAYETVTGEHQGQLTVASHPGAFSEFCIKLPLDVVKPGPPPPGSLQRATA